MSVWEGMLGRCFASAYYSEKEWSTFSKWTFRRSGNSGDFSLWGWCGSKVMHCLFVRAGYQQPHNSGNSTWRTLRPVFWREKSAVWLSTPSLPFLSEAKSEKHQHLVTELNIQTHTHSAHISLSIIYLHTDIYLYIYIHMFRYRSTYMYILLWFGLLSRERTIYTGYIKHNRMERRCTRSNVCTQGQDENIRTLLLVFC